MKSAFRSLACLLRPIFPLSLALSLAALPSVVLAVPGIGAGLPAGTKLGADLDGEAASDESGYSVSLSADGSIVAIGAPSNDGSENSSGHLRIFQYSGNAWGQVGSDIDGEAANDDSGWSVSLSTDGETVAIGAPNNNGGFSDNGHVRVYQLSGGAWTQVGGDIDGEASFDYSGWSVSLSGDGSTVAIGAYRNDGNGDRSGHVRIYQFSGGAWTQMGNDIDGEAASDQSGYSVSLSADGSTVAIGAPDNDGNGGNSGHVRIYQFSGSTWTQVGADIDGEGGTDYSGRSVSLTPDGSMVAIGATEIASNSTTRGYVRVFQLSGGVWTQVGASIVGEGGSDESGNSVALSADGSIVAIGAQLNNGNGTDSGHVRIYQYSGGAWAQVGADINGEAGDDRSGWSVALSEDGSTVAIGAHYNDGNGSKSGHVRVYATGASSGGVVDPEIALSGNGVNINYGDVTPSLSDHTDFDSANVIGGTVSRTFTIINSGTTDLTLTGTPPNYVTLSGTGASHFSVSTQPASSTVSPGGGTRTFVVTFDPNSIGTKNATVSIASNDADESPFTSSIRGAGLDTVPEIALSGNGVNIANGDSSPRTTDHTDFGSANITSIMVSRIFTITNSGTANLTLAGTPPNYVTLSGTGASHFSVTTQPASATVSSGGGGTQTFVVTFDPSTTGTHIATVSIANNDADENPFAFAIAGTGVLGLSPGTQLGLDIDGEAAGDHSGGSVALSADGSTVAIGAYLNDGNGSGSGHVRIYQFSGGTWTQLGADIDGEASGDWSGDSLALSADGSIVAVGAPLNDGNGSDSGHVRIYQFSGGTWTQLGADIDGEAAGDESGYNVSLSADGGTVAIGAPYNDGNGSDSGHVRIYQFSGGAWTKVGSDINGEVFGDESGYSVSLSADGSTVAIGAPYNSSVDRGHVRIYQFSGGA